MSVKTVLVSNKTETVACITADEEKAHGMFGRLLALGWNCPAAAGACHACFPSVVDEFLDWLQA